MHGEGRHGCVAIAKISHMEKKPK
uniref:Uncharacterized protein n=1 Tax=Anguilla anguilla TaxID=7936 RepID=A0A0E9R3E5_ANGAN